MLAFGSQVDELAMARSFSSSMQDRFAPAKKGKFQYHMLARPTRGKHLFRAACSNWPASEQGRMYNAGSQVPALAGPRELTPTTQLGAAVLAQPAAARAVATSAARPTPPSHIARAGLLPCYPRHLIQMPLPQSAHFERVG